MKKGLSIRTTIGDILASANILLFVITQERTYWLQLLIGVPVICLIAINFFQISLMMRNADQDSESSVLASFLIRNIISFLLQIGQTIISVSHYHALH